MSVAFIGEKLDEDKWNQEYSHVVYDKKKNRWVVNQKNEEKKTIYSVNKIKRPADRFEFLDFT